MKKILFLLFLLSLLAKGMGQPSATISGKIKDSATGSPLSYVTVHLLIDSNTIIKRAFSDSTGSYALAVAIPGNYFLSFSLAGYHPGYSSSIAVFNTSQIHTGTYFLSPNTKQLSQVTIFSRKPLIEKSTDGIIYNVQQDLLAAGGTAIDVLRKTPMVSVGQDETPSLRGSSNIRVFIDDKPSDLYASSVADALKQIPAEEIVKVEVILYPSAKYDAEGTDGVINIITRKKKLNGTSGTFSLNGGLRYNNSALSLNSRKQKWIFNIDAGGYTYGGKNGSVFTRRDSAKNILQQKNEGKGNGYAFYSGLNIIYSIDSLKTVYGGYRFRTNNNPSDRLSQNVYYTGDSTVDSFKRSTENNMGNNVNSLNVGYTAKSKNQRRELKVLVSYFKHQGYNDYELGQFRQENMDYRENSNSNTNNAEKSMQVDYTQKLSGIASIETGLKTMNRNATSSNRFEIYQFPPGKFIDDNSRATDFTYRRDVYAVYSNLNITLKSWQIRFGSRYEQTLLKANFKDSPLQLPGYKNFVPSILVSKNIENHSLKWSYSKQIQRPYISYLNPSINYSDSLNLEFGNPYLLPEITHRYEIGYTGTIKSIFAGASLFYTRNRNSIENIRMPAYTGIFKSTYQNIGKKEAIGLSGNISWKKEQFNISANVTWRYIMLNSPALQLSNNGFIVNGNLNLSWKFKNGYSAEGQIYINSNDIRLQGQREGWKFYSFVLNKKMKNEKLSISLRTETFNRHITEDFITPAFFQQTITRYQNLFFQFGLSWKIGKKEIRVPATQQGATE